MFRKRWVLPLQLIFLCCVCPLFVSGGAGKSIEETSSLRVAGFFVLFIILSILIEEIFHNVEHYLEHKHDTGTLSAVHKIKEELFLMGFISLLLLVFEDTIVRVCVPVSPTHVGIPCCASGSSNKTVIARDHDLCINNVMKNESNFHDLATGCYTETCCDHYAYKHWVESGAYAPKLGSPLASVCPAIGQPRVQLLTEQHDFECKPLEDGTPTSSLLDPKTLHQLHTMIFLIAAFHVTYSMTVMLISMVRVQQWTKWETYGDDDDETPDKLKYPTPHRNKCMERLITFGEQFYHPVDPLSYVAIRRYFIIRHGLKTDFCFNAHLLESYKKDYKQLVGVSWWMWLVVCLLAVGEGYIPNYPWWMGFFRLLNTYIAIICVLTAGGKLMSVFKNFQRQVLERINKDNDGTLFQKPRLTAEDVDILQNGPLNDPELMNDLRPNFWCQNRKCCGRRIKSPHKFLLILIRLTMFQNSVTFAHVVFFAWQIKPGLSACWFNSRNPITIGLAMITAIVILFINSFVTVPLYSICSIATEEQLSKSFKSKDKDRNEQVTDLVQEIEDHLNHLKARPAPKPTPQADLPDTMLTREEVDKICNGIFTEEKQQISAKDFSLILHKKLGAQDKWANKSPKHQSGPLTRTLSMGRHMAAVKMAIKNVRKKIGDGQTNQPTVSQGSKKQNFAKVAPVETTEAKTETAEAKIEPTKSKGLSVSRSFRRVKTSVINVVKPMWDFLVPVILLGTLFLLLAFFVQFWKFGNFYGYYVPHWSYDGWGGPPYWSTLTPNGGYGAHDITSWVEDYKEKKGKSPATYSLCSKGLQQSPIDIRASAWTKPNRPRNYVDYSDTTHPADKGGVSLGDILVVEPNKLAPYYGHSLLKFYCTSGHHGCGKLYWGETQDKSKCRKADTYNHYYTIFHTPSEHTIDKTHFPMEMQVHHCNGACDSKSDWVVVSVLFLVGEPTSSGDEIAKMWGKDGANLKKGATWKQRKQKKKKKYADMKTTKDEIDYTNIFRLDAGFYHYHGSETTPPCKQNHQYLVMNSPVQMTLEQLNIIQDTIGYPGNARPLQDLNSRTVTYYSKPKANPPFSIPLPARGGGAYAAQPPYWAAAQHCSDAENHGSQSAEEGKYTKNFVKKCSDEGKCPV